MELKNKVQTENDHTNLYPKDWKHLNLGHSAILKARIGWQGLTTAEYLNTGEYYLITGTDFNGGYIDWDNCVYVEKLRFDQDKNIQVKIGDVLVTKDGTIGKVAYIDKLPKNTTLNSGVFVIRPINKSYHPRYFYYVLMSEHFKQFLGKLTAGSTISHLYQKDFVYYDFPLPPTLEEQKAIATALSDIDELISNLDKLITKKKALKQGAMQQLLTPPHKGGNRLEGFSGEWEEKTIKEIVLTPVTDGPHETPRFVKEGVPFLSVNNIVNNKINYSDLRYISKEDDITYSKKCKPIKNDILLGKAASVGKVAVVEKDLDINIWSPLALIRCKSNYYYYYVFYSFQTSEMYKQIDGLTNSSSQGNIGMGDIEKLKILFPKTIEEQKSIAEILFNMDLEIEHLEAKKAKYQSVKKGMMQELLTGKTRLI
jgi:type I restriction enzyme, S subunit